MRVPFGPMALMQENNSRINPASLFMTCRLQRLGLERGGLADRLDPCIR
jgi:hypothetical protein